MKDADPAERDTCILTCKEWQKKNIAENFVFSILGIAKNKSGASGFFRMMERGLRSR